jgi:hypothetical protein
VRPFSVTNTTDQNLILMAIKITIPDGAKGYTCTIAGDELTATGLVQTLAAHAKTSVSCSLKCGSVVLSQQKAYASKIEVLAVREQDNEVAVPEKAEGDISIVNPEL